MRRKGRAVKPAHAGYFALFGSDTERNASVQRNGIKLDVEAVAVGVCPRAADANPVVVAAFAL